MLITTAALGIAIVLMTIGVKLTIMALSPNPKKRNRLFEKLLLTYYRLDYELYRLKSVLRKFHMKH